MKALIKCTFVAGLMPLLSFTAFPQKSSTTKTGKQLFENNCSRCHGNDGARGRWGAKNLQLSTMADEELLHIITNGKKVMPAWKYTLTTEDINLVKNYIKTLRN